MCRGLSTIQQQILKDVEASNEETITASYTVVLADDVIDLRNVIKKTAETLNRTYCRGAYVEGKFQVSFYRAVRSLIRRKLLFELPIKTFVPIKSYKLNYGIKEREDYGNSAIQHLQDGLYLMISGKQLRFVSNKVQ